MNRSLLFFLVLTALSSEIIYAQAPTPAKTYQNNPVGMQLFQVGYGLQSTNTTVDGAITLPDNSVNIKTDFGYLRYAVFFKLFNKLSGFQAVVPFVWIDADVLGVNRKNSGLGDMTFIFGTAIIGGKPLTLRQILQTPKTLGLAWSLGITAPTGSYSTDKLLNPSSHRWQIKPELGLSIPVKKFDIEFNAAAKFFTENTESPSLLSITPSKSVTQKPFFSLTNHTLYNFNQMFWISFDAAARFGGETTKNGTAEGNSQSLFAIGGSAGLIIPNIHHQFGVNYITKVAGNDYAPEGSILNVTYSYVFGPKFDETLRKIKK